MKLNIEISHTDGLARTGTVTTARGQFQTPVFMPVGTRGSIRAVTSHELATLHSSTTTANDDQAVDVEIMLANTYHLMLRPGEDVVQDLGGLHQFSGWDGHMLTDSGGFQVFSLQPTLTEEGALFSSTYDGSKHMLTPERAVAIQEALGADIQMVLDVCAALPATRDALHDALLTTARWAKRAKAAHQRHDDQSLFGIVQGGTLTDLRKESAQRTVELDFDGYAIGGLSVGEPRDEMLPALAAAVGELPVDQPRYLMGVGDPVSIIEAVARGVDMFDCVLPTRLGRHGTLLTSLGKLNIKRQEFARSTDPLDPGCSCTTCTRYERGYLRHLFSVNEPTASTLASIHNLSFMLGFVQQIRAAIATSSLDDLRLRTQELWGDMGPSSTTTPQRA